MSAWPAPPDIRIADPVTPERLVAHEHFSPGQRVVIICGRLDGDLAGPDLQVVAPSWHTPTGEDGWRLRNPEGGQRTFLTAHPRYMIHVEKTCSECAAHLRRLSKALLPKMPKKGLTAADWYQRTALDQIVHTADLGGSQ